MADTAVFDCARDREQIAAGTHFFCQTHQTAVPIEQQSPDLCYCQSCYDFLTDSGRHIGDWKPETPGKVATVDASLPLPVAKITVTKIVDGEILLPTTKQGARVIMLRRRGRPPKPENEPVSRMTLWRRQQKRLQGVLL